MASILKSKALSNINKGNTSAYYSYVEEKNGTNPVLQQLEKELSDYMGFVKKKQSENIKPGEHAACKVSDALFDIWNKFEPRITKRHFYQKLMQIGEFLVQYKEYSAAAWQCYDRYLNQFINDINFSMIKNVQDLKEKFFPESESKEENNDVTFRALMGHCICLYHFTITTDPKFQNVNSIQQLCEVLRIIRLIMQFQLEVEEYCWLVYNGTIYLYTICRYMMQYGLSKQVLEYLIWSCLCMETSIPLLGVKYLTWRATLYVATCQCYYDCKYSEDGERFEYGETFARRALSKINELHELELASISGQKGADAPQFRDATIKVGTMLFKRLVYESRRKPKNVLRPKTRMVYKDLNLQIWPRTGTEKLLAEMFDCAASRFLAVEEALNDSNRRIGMPTPAGTENDVEILDVTLELFFAAEFLANGGGGKQLKTSFDILGEFKAITPDNKTLIQMAIDNQDTIPIKNLIKIIQLAFSYESWDMFRRLSNKILVYFQTNTEVSNRFNSEIQILNLLQTIDKYLLYLRRLKMSKSDQIKEKNKKSRQVQSRVSPDGGTKRSDTSATDAADADGKKTNLPEISEQLSVVDDDAKSQAGSLKSGKSKKSRGGKSRGQLSEIAEDDYDDTEGGTTPHSSNESMREEDLLANIANKLMQVISLKTKTEKLDLDIMIDTTLMLWKKCKEVFQKFQTGAQDNYRWVTKLENLGKWLYILNVVHESMCYFNISSIDPGVFAHCTLRLGLVYESLANIGSRKSALSSMPNLQLNEDERATTVRILDLKSAGQLGDSLGEKLMTSDVKGNLLKAKKILKHSLPSLAAARAAISKSDKSCLCNKNYDETASESNDGSFEQLKALKESIFQYKKNQQGDSIWNMISDLHVELIFLYNKISVRLLEFGENSTLDITANFEKNFEQLLKECRKNKISQSLLYLSKALYFNGSPGKYTKQQKELVEKAYNCLIKAEEEDKNMFNKHVKVDATIPVESKVPLPPVVCLTTYNKVIITPRVFKPSNGAAVSWYRIFASLVSGANSKARISDYTFPGTGDQIPSNSADQITIQGLNSDEKYIFAVAAYDKNGKLIGDSIGDSTDPILASSTLSLLMNWAYLCQVSYQTENYSFSKIAFDILWNYFIFQPIEKVKDTVSKQNEINYQLTYHQLNYNVIRKTSPILLRKFIECLFISVDIQVKENQIYPDILFDGKIAYPRQIERFKECEKMMVAIDLAGWLNDPQIILQAVVQCYGLVAPLIFYNIPYEPITQILTQCLLVLEEIPIGVYQRKPKPIFESLQHMNACTTFYLTEVLKKMNKKTLANVFNMIGRRLLSIEESASALASAEDENEFFSSDTAESKSKPIASLNLVTQVKSIQKKEKQGNNSNTNNKNNQSAVEEKVSTKNDEWKALELYMSRTTKTPNVYAILNGTEDTTFIYGFISHSPTKYVYKELVKFRKRTTFMELLVYYLHKAMTEELINDIRDFCSDTDDWLLRRNIAILGNRAVITKKPGGVVTVAGNQQLTGSLGEFEDNKKGAKNSTSSIGNFTTFKKRKIKKYKLLIPLDLKDEARMKLEDTQKAAIDKIYDIFPEMHDNWMRRKRLRRLLHEESTFKAQFYTIWALNEFSALMNRLNQSSGDKIFSNDFIEPQYFLFDTNNCLLLSEENRYNLEIFKENEGEKAELLPIPPTKGKPVAQQLSKRQSMIIQSKASKAKAAKTAASKNSKSTKTPRSNQNKTIEVKDTSELIAESFYGLDIPDDDLDTKSSVVGLTNENLNKSQSKNLSKSNSQQQPPSRYTNTTNTSNFTVSPPSFKDIVDSIKKIFLKFNQAVIISHRYKEWTLLQNSCKTLTNCMNALLIWLPAASSDSIEIKLNDIWTLTGSYLYTAADNLIDMLFCNSPIDKSNNNSIRRINKWYDSASVGKGGAGLTFDVPLDDSSSIDLRFVKKFIYRAIQCLFVNRQWEKLASIILKFNALTSYAFAEQLSPILIFAQHQLRKRVAINQADAEKRNTSDIAILRQPHFVRLKAELGREPKPEDLLFIQFKTQIEASAVKPLNLGVKIDPRVHDIYDGERAQKLISVPLDISQSKQNLKDAIVDTLYTSRMLIHARRLFTLYLLSKSKQTEFFGIKVEKDDTNMSFSKKQTNPVNNADLKIRTPGHVEFDNENIEKLKHTKYRTEFLPNPPDLVNENFDHENEICVKEVNVELKTVIESYKKCISLLTSHKEKDLAVQAMHELGNIYYYKKDLKSTYYWWTEALDLLTSCKDCLVKWRKEFINKTTNSIDYLMILEKFGLWGAFMGGLIASKFAQYLLPNDIELRGESCLLAATFYKAIYQSSVPYSKHDVDYTKEDSETINTEFLLPGLNLNSDLFRFDLRNIIQSLNYICLELIDGKYCLDIIPALNLYEYFARNLTRSVNHTVNARLLKIEALLILNKYNEAVTLIQRIQRGERLPLTVDEKIKTFLNSLSNKYLYVNWNSAKPIYDIDNLKCLEAILSLKLPFGAIKLYGPHLICRFYMVQCKFFVQIASHLTCMPDFKVFESTELKEYHNTYKSKGDRVPTSKLLQPPPSIPTNTSKKLNSFQLAALVSYNEDLDENPETLKVFSRSKNLTLEYVKGCLLGTAKVLASKCIKLFNEDFPNVDRYCVSSYWQREFKYELNLLLANIADQSQLDYLALQYVIDAMNELIITNNEIETSREDFGTASVESFKYSSISAYIAPIKAAALLEHKESKNHKKGLFEVFDLISKSHLNSRLWINARKIFTKYMLNQLSDLGKAKGVDPNIIKDFADLKYYCDKGYEEAVGFQDCESKAYFEFINAIIDLTQTNDINGCLNKLRSTIRNLKLCLQLSLEGEKLLLKAKLLEIDLAYSLNVIDSDEKNQANEESINGIILRLIESQDYLLDKLKTYEGDSIEAYVDRKIGYFDFISNDIKNISSSFLSYLVHVKLRLGSCLIVKAAATIGDNMSLKLWQDALKIFHHAIALNKVIAERSLALETELKYKYSRCIRELFVRKQCTIKEVIDTYLDVINLCYYSTHDLLLIKNCYLELAMAFIHQFNPNVVIISRTPVISPDVKIKKTVAIAKAIDGAFICLNLATKVSRSIREKMLLPGHDILKQMESVQTKGCPIFIANDLLAYYVMAERKRIYKNKIEEEVLTLAPEFEKKISAPTYDDKYERLCAESDKSITWTHLLNYHTKLQRINSMKNLNQLSSGQNRYKYSEFFTLSFTPVFNNFNQNSARMCQLNSYLSSNLEIYDKECMAAYPLVEALKLCARKGTASAASTPKEKDIKMLLDNVKIYDGNRGQLEFLEKLTMEQEYELQLLMQNLNGDIDEVNKSLSFERPKAVSWQNLEIWPSNYKATDEHPNKSTTEVLQVLNDLVSFNWYKDMGSKDASLGHLITGIICVKDTSGVGNHQIKIKLLPAERVYDIHHKLATLAAIADTALESADSKTNADMKNEFINSLKSCLSEIAEIFNKKFDFNMKDFKHFELKPSNVIELERMFNPMFGGQTNNESLKTFLLNLF